MGSRHTLHQLPSEAMQDEVDEKINSPLFYLNLKKQILENQETKKISRKEFLKTTNLLNYLMKNSYHIFNQLDIDSEASHESFFTVFNTINRFCDIYNAAFPAFKLDSEGDLKFRNQALNLENILNESDSILKFYAQFYPKSYWQEIKKFKPDLILLFGKFPEDLIWTVPFSQRIKDACPDAHISIVQAELVSLFNSMTQIVDKIPNAFFNIIDSVVMYEDYSEQTILDLVAALENGEDIGSIDNLLIYDKVQGKTRFIKPDRSRIIRYTKTLTLLPARNNFLKCQKGLETSPPQHKTRLAIIHPLKRYCYWNRCGFCVVNKKKIIASDGVELTTRVEDLICLVKQLVREGCRKFGFFCEAMPFEFFDLFSRRVLEETLAIEWFSIGRFEAYYTPEFIKRLKDSGLCGMFFGVETFNEDLLVKLNKYHLTRDDILKIIRTLDDHGIHTHLNFIAGFPSETKESFNETLDLLSKIIADTCYTSFAMNRFTLRINSPIAEHPDQFGIGRLLSNPNELSNEIDWESTTGMSRAQHLKNVDRSIRAFYKHMFGDDHFHDIPANLVIITLVEKMLLGFVLSNSRHLLRKMKRMHLGLENFNRKKRVINEKIETKEFNGFTWLFNPENFTYEVIPSGVWQKIEQICGSENMFSELAPNGLNSINDLFQKDETEFLKSFIHKKMLV